MTEMEIICAGYGGQGVLVTGLIIANAAMEDGKEILWYPSYGVEVRGGTANCNVKISEDEIASPFIRKADIVIAMNEASVTKFEPRVKDGGILLVNSSTVKPRKYRDNIKVYEVPASEIANRAENPKGANVVVLGVLAKKARLFGVEYLRKSMQDFFLNKGKDNPKNAICFDEGVSYFE